MILVLKQNASKEDVERLLEKLQQMQLQAVPSQENGRYSVAVVSGISMRTDLKPLALLPTVESILPLARPFKLADRAFKKERTMIHIQNHTIGGNTLTVMAGPCSVESEVQIHEAAALVAAAGANILRGGAFKPRTSPYDFQGLGAEGLCYMEAAAKAHGLLTVSEVMDAQDIDRVASHIDILQIGARNMQNFSLLKHVGKSGKPILLKRGLSATYLDFLMAAEYILQTGNPNVILCERGIRTFETYTRNVLDIAAVPVLHELSHLPVIVDPSHGTGIRSLVSPMACAAVAAGADGIMIEVHPDPDNAISDAKQTISPKAFADMMTLVRQIDSLVR